MNSRKTRISARNNVSRRTLVALGLALAFVRSAIGTTLRIAEYNIDCSDQDNNNAVTGSSAGIPSVIQAMGLHHLGTDAPQPVDVMTLT